MFPPGAGPWLLLGTPALLLSGLLSELPSDAAGFLPSLTSFCMMVFWFARLATLLFYFLPPVVLSLCLVSVDVVSNSTTPIIYGPLTF